MIKFSYKANKKADVKSVVMLDIKVSELVQYGYTQEEVDEFTEYGLAVELQAMGRAGTLEGTLEHRDIPYKIEHDVPVKKAVTKADIIAEFLGIPVEDVTSELSKKVQELINKKK